MKLILASGSPRRRELLASAGFCFEVVAPSVDETPSAGESAGAYAQRMAREKCAAVARDCPGAVVIAADTIVVLDERILGKPKDAADARRMLASLSGREHDVMTAVALAGGGRTHVFAPVTRVSFAALTDAALDRYVAGGEPMDKAGAYGIQGGAAGMVRAIRGSYTNVVGLPLAEVIACLKEAFEIHPE